MTTIKINGTNTLFDSLSLNQSVNGHHSFSIECDARQLGQEDSVIGAEDASKLIGKDVSFNIKAIGDAVVNFEGLITGVELSKHHRSYDVVMFFGKSKTILADSSKKAETYTDKNLGHIAKEVLKSLGKLNVDIAGDKAIEFVCQYRESGFDLISRLASKYGQWFYYDGTQTCLGKYQKKETIKMKLGPNIGTYNLSLSMLPLSASNIHYDYINHETYSVSSFDTPDPKLDRFGKVVYDASKKKLNEDGFSPGSPNFVTENDLKDFVNFRVSNKAAKMCQLHGDSTDARIKIGTAIDLIDRQDNSIGTYFVIEVNHNCEGSKSYANNFKAVPSTIEVPPYNSFIKTPKSPPQIATIKENNDPDKLGRVKVQFPWQNQNETTPWIRVLNPYSGGGDMYFLPEVDDQVMVGFEMDHPNRPFVMGSMYHGKAGPQYFTEENTTKAIHTKCGHKILFEDGDDSQISIITKDDKHSIVLTLADDGCINITTAGTMNLKAKELNLTADDINIEASQKLSLKGADINIEAQQGVEIKGTNAKMEGQAEVAIKGAQAKVEGDATTTIKGGLVQIN